VPLGLDLTPIRSAVVSILDTSVTIQRNSSGVWTAIGVVLTRFYQSNYLPQENPSQTQRLFIDDRWRFLFAVNTDVVFQDRIVFGARKWEVIQVPTSSLALFRLVIAQELTA